MGLNVSFDMKNPGQNPPKSPAGRFRRPFARLSERVAKGEASICLPRTVGPRSDGGINYLGWVLKTHGK